MAGAWTWQLPYRSGAAVLYELERTLCPDDSVDVEKLNDDCGQYHTLLTYRETLSHLCVAVLRASSFAQ